MRDLGIIQKLPRLVCAQSASANPLYKSYLAGFERYSQVTASPTVATAIQIGNPVSIDRAIPVIKALDGIVEQATEDELLNAAAEADRTGLFTCPQTGVALAAMKKLVQKREIDASDRVVVISTANGLKFVDFKVDYHQDRIPDITSQLNNEPIELPGDYGSVLKALNSALN